jgi:hypothetical protein
MKRRAEAAIYCLSLVVFSNPPAKADDVLDIQVKALAAISTFATETCNTVKTTGSSQSVEASSEIKAKLAGVAKKLVDLGIEGSTKYASKQEDLTVLQQDLAGAIKTNADCKRGVLELLEKKMIPARKSEASPTFGFQFAFGGVAIPGMSFEEMKTISPKEGAWADGKYTVKFADDDKDVRVIYELNSRTGRIDLVDVYAVYESFPTHEQQAHATRQMFLRNAEYSRNECEFVIMDNGLVRACYIEGAATFQGYRFTFVLRTTEARTDGKTNYGGIKKSSVEKVFPGIAFASGTINFIAGKKA